MPEPATQLQHRTTTLSDVHGQYDRLLIPAAKSVNRYGELVLGRGPGLRAIARIAPRLKAYAGLVLLENYSLNPEHAFHLVMFQDAYRNLGLFQVKAHWEADYAEWQVFLAAMALREWLQDAQRTTGQCPNVALIDPLEEAPAGTDPTRTYQKLAEGLRQYAAHVTVLHHP